MPLEGSVQRKQVGTILQRKESKWRPESSACGLDRCEPQSVGCRTPVLIPQTAKARGLHWEPGFYLEPRGVEPELGVSE